ncbi:MAG: DUF1800 domain-containing protein [Chloroflexi bacterium]|nr:MAG: DUF1800 domain-containing protein [Chloroflexota bacterium]
MNRLTRRAFLSAITLSAAGCASAINSYTQPDLPSVVLPPTGVERDPVAHLLNRATYGPRPGQIARVRAIGRDSWLEQQLDYTSIDEDTVTLRLRRFDTLRMKPRDLLSFRSRADRRYVRDELAAMTLVRAVYSERQLYEVMVGFWSDHFNIYHFKGDTANLKTVDDREVIRPHALGNFGDMLRASAHSPAMLVYLDNVANEKSHPNENYAREIMELHTLGVDGGYTEHDIKEVARCFTGWSINERGEFIFISNWHDFDEKRVLGHIIRSDDGVSDGDRVLDILLEHPATPRFVCTKLVRRLVADDPPESIVDAAVRAWRGNNGDIAPVLRAIFTHPEFETAPPKLKRPYELLVSLLRVTNASYNGDNGAINRLDQLGHRPFGWPTPDGFPDTALEWTGNQLGRWNLMIDAFTGSLPGINIDVEALADVGRVHIDDVEALNYFGRLLLKRDLLPNEVMILRDVAETDTLQAREVLGLLAASPAFQWR